uniref:RPW8 domain-containing protein n=1 Tax=Picea sitchensis TaxID=3332 RepID=A9NSG8_PICSI|nr:unknown [Picea sitchensis]
MDLVIQTVAGVAAQELLVDVKDVVGKCFGGQNSCQRLLFTVEAMIPILQESLNTGVELSQHRQEQLRDFCEELQKGKELVQNRSRVGRCSYYERLKYDDKIEELESYIAYFNRTQGWLHAMSDLHHLKVHVGNIESETRALREECGIFRKFVNENKSLFGIVKKDSDSSVPDLPECPVGLEISVHNLRKRLLCEDVRLLGIKGMGGSGKTTLATAICVDPQVKGERSYIESDF